MAKDKKAKPSSPKLDKATKKQLKAQMAADPKVLLTRAARLVVFLLASWPTLDAFAQGALTPGTAVWRILLAAVFATLAVGLVTGLVGGYLPQRPGPEDDPEAGVDDDVAEASPWARPPEDDAGGTP